MKKILKLIPILFIALMMISCSDEAQSPSLDGEPIPPDSGLFEDNGYTVYDKVIDTYEGTSNEPWVLTVGKDQIKLSIDKNSLGEIISGVEGAPLFPRDFEIPKVLEINLLNSGSIQNFLDFFCHYRNIEINDPFALLPRETKTVTINTVTGLDAIKDDPEMSIESVTWFFRRSNDFGDFEISGDCEYTTADDGKTISTITLKEVPITADYLDIEVIAKKGDSSTKYEARINDLYHPTNKDGKVYADATDVTAEFSLITQEDSDPSEFDWHSLEVEMTAKLISSDGRYVADETNPYYEITIKFHAEMKYTKDGKLAQMPEGYQNPLTTDETVIFRLKKDATSGNLILSEMYDSDEDGTDDEESEIGKYTKRK